MHQPFSSSLQIKFYFKYSSCTSSCGFSVPPNVTEVQPPAQKMQSTSNVCDLSTHANWEKTAISTLSLFSHSSFFSFQCEENANFADCSRYLKMPFSKANLPSNNQTLKGVKESFWITSFLCSTKLTQNGKAARIARTAVFQQRSRLNFYSSLTKYAVTGLCFCCPKSGIEAEGIMTG